MSSAQSAAGIVARFTPQVGGCWKILDLRVRVESRLLCANETTRPELSCTFGPSKKEDNVPPLHHYEREEIHALSLIEQLIRKRGRVISELENQ
jgi:hypothetical protein